MELEGIGEADALERLIVSADQTVIDGLDIDSGDIIGQQDNLVGVDFIFRPALSDGMAANFA